MLTIRAQKSSGSTETHTAQQIPRVALLYYKPVLHCRERIMRHGLHCHVTDSVTRVTAKQVARLQGAAEDAEKCY